MFKGYFKILSLLIAIFWVLASNHCAFENQILGSEDTQSSDECAGHQNQDPKSHAEGKPCSLEAINTQQQKLVHSPYIFVGLFQIIVPYSNETNLGNKNVLVKTQTDIHPIGSNALISLSIASNAPPVSI
ncbi:MAG: hypothetical protein KBC84_06515 [Proteobacteria bacterium]|nr:hypothetical protein [Pseudomonadota bacterium]